MVEFVLSADLLRNQKHLKRSFMHALNTCTPPLLRKALVEMVDRKRTTPDESTVRRARFSLDTALSLLVRAEWEAWQKTKPPMAAYIWSDTSPQGQHNWSLTEVHVFRPESDLAFYEALQGLVAARLKGFTCGTDLQGEGESSASMDCCRDEQDASDGVASDTGFELDSTAAPDPLPKLGANLVQSPASKPQPIESIQLLESCLVTSCVPFILY